MALALFLGGSVAAADTNGVALNGSLVSAGRLGFQVGSNALPAQIIIAATPDELPLENRKADGPKVSEQDLQAMGRGAQLKSPVRIEAVVGGKATALVPVEPAVPVLTGETVTFKAKLAGGGVNATVDSSVARDGTWSCKVTYGGGAKVDSLGLVMELNGLADLAVCGGTSLKTNDVSLSDDEGLLWGNAAPVAGAAPTAANRGVPGVLSQFFLGNGDRGWTWLSDGNAGWMIAPVAPAMTVTRDKSGTIVWRVMFVNQPAELKGDKTVSFSLLTHPAAVRTAGFRKTMWLDWPFAGKAAMTTKPGTRVKPGAAGVVRADAGAVVDGQVGALLLAGEAGGDAETAAKTLADTFSLSVFRYLAGTYTGIGGRLLSNAEKLIRPGQNPACDRMVLGRALLHDLGVDPAGIAHLAMAAQVVGALSDFGYFSDDGRTEYIPYWRSRALVRYGEVFNAKDAFEENAADPMARVKVSIWRRPADAGTGAKAMILIVNEGDVPVREQLYLLSPAKLFGGPNGLTYRDCAARWDVSALPSNSDWAGINKGGHVLAAGQDGPTIKRNGRFLLDIEDLGGTTEVADKDGVQVYGRTFVPARGFRLLMGSAVPQKSDAQK